MSEITLSLKICYNISVEGKSYFLQLGKEGMDSGSLTIATQVRIADIEEIVREQDKAAQKLANIDNEIIAIQRSTKTDLPFMQPLHNYLRMHWRWYYNFHMSHYYSRINWLVLLGIICGTLFYSLK